MVAIVCALALLISSLINCFAFKKKNYFFFEENSLIFDSYTTLWNVADVNRYITGWSIQIDNLLINTTQLISNT